MHFCNHVILTMQDLRDLQTIYTSKYRWLIVIMICQTELVDWKILFYTHKINYKYTFNKAVRSCIEVNLMANNNNQSKKVHVKLRSRKKSSQFERVKVPEYLSPGSFGNANENCTLYCTRRCIYCCCFEAENREPDAPPRMNYTHIGRGIHILRLLLRHDARRYSSLRCAPRKIFDASRAHAARK